MYRRLRCKAVTTNRRAKLSIIRREIAAARSLCTRLEPAKLAVVRLPVILLTYLLSYLLTYCHVTLVVSSYSSRRHRPVAGAICRRRLPPLPVPVRSRDGSGVTSSSGRRRCRCRWSRASRRREYAATSLCCTQRRRKRIVKYCHTVMLFSERELTFTFAICCRPSVCRLSVCRR